MKLRLTTMHGLVVAGGVAGFPLAAALSALLSIRSTPLSIGLRGSILLLACILLYSARGFGRLKQLAVALILIFWLLYLLRLVDASLFEADILSRPLITYWTFAMGACLTPMIALATNRNAMCGNRLYWLIMAPSAGTCLIALLVGSTAMQSSAGIEFDAGRLNLDSLNPIFLGHIGATVALMAIWRMRHVGRPQAMILGLPLAALGIYIVLLSASRGPILAFAVGLLLIEIFKGWRSMLLMAFPLLAVVSFLSVDLSLIDRALGTQTFSRFQSAVEIEDSATVGRVNSFAGAWDQFLDNPITGDALEERTSRNYPHNIVLEAFMATGVLGGIALLLGLLWLTLQAVRLVQAKISHSWVGVLLIQYMIGSQLSGAIWSSNQLWTLAGLIIGLSPTLMAKQRERRLGANSVIAATSYATAPSYQ